MKLSFSRLRQVRDEDSGAVVAIVALSLIALLGMVVISVDVGGLVVQRRYMVNANDSAALAAAQSFALNEGGADCAGGVWAPAQDKATLLADSNVAGSILNSFQPNCTQQTVAVQYSKPQQLFFAQVLGFGSTANVTATATAEWGSPGAANPVPIVMYEQAYNNCKFDTDGVAGTRCYVWEDNNNTSGNQSGFGMLDLGSGWNVAGSATCPNPGTADVNSWIDGSANLGELTINYPAATYVCRISGMAQSVWDYLATLDKGKIIFFPINRCDPTLPGQPYGQVASNGSEVACPDTPDKYDIIGYVAMRLIDVVKPNDASVNWTACPQTSPGTPVTLKKPYVPLSLDQYGFDNGCFTQAPDQIDSASVAVAKVNAGGPALQRGPDISVSQPTCPTTADWCYDPANTQIIWSGIPEADYTVSFNYRNPGPCGYPPAGNNSGHCLVLDWVKRYLGGTKPNGGFGGSNLQAVGLVK